MQNIMHLLENVITVRPVIAQPMISINNGVKVNLDTKVINTNFPSLTQGFHSNIKYTLEYFLLNQHFV